MRRIERLADHPIFIAGDIRGAGTSQVEDTGGIGDCARTRQVARKEGSHVFRQGDAEIRGAFSGEALGFGRQSDLSTCHHDVSIIPSFGTDASKDALRPLNVEEEFAIAFCAGDGGFDDFDGRTVELFDAGSDAIDGELVGCGVADNAAFADVFAAGFELRLDEDDGFEVWARFGSVAGGADNGR